MAINFDIPMDERLRMYNTKTFSNIFPDLETFKDTYVSSPLYAEGHTLEDANIDILFYLLYARYGNNPIANLSEHQFVYKMFSIIFQYGPTWQKELSIQSELRDKTLTQLSQGAIQKYGHAFNDASNPGDWKDIKYFNEQNINEYTKGLLDTYNDLEILLKKDVTETFINRFKVCFKTMVRPDWTYIYETELEND